MTVVVADSSPLNYLILIGSIDIGSIDALQALFGRILVPGDVIRELHAPTAPTEVRGWADALPPWVTAADDGFRFDSFGAT